MKLTDDEADTLIVILDDKVSECSEETLDEYYNKAADLTLAIKQLHFSNEIEHPKVRERVKAVMEQITEQWLKSANHNFEARTKCDNKTELLSDIKRTCEYAVEYLGILIKLETQEIEE